MSRSNLRPSQEGVAQVVAFLVGGSIFVVALAGILLVSRDSGSDNEAADSSAQTLKAGSLLDVVVGSPGVGWANPDTLQRLGLQASNGTGLNLDALDALRGAQYESSASNGLVDYEEARASLGIPDGTDFHLRMYPVGLDASYQASLAGTRVAYIGDWTSLPPQIVSQADPIKEAQANYNLTAGPYTQAERAAILELGVDFTNSVYLSPATPQVLVQVPPDPDSPLFTYLGITEVSGDVYPDNKQYLDAVLASRLSQYDVLIVGSQVDQSSLTSNGVKGAIKDWVLGGGTLIVFGSSSQNFQWIQPLFSVGTANVNGGAFAPDVSHPLLHEPNSLNWDAYDNHGLGWDIKDTGSGAHYDDFTHVVVEGGEDVLAVSNQGAFGDGRIFLTTFRAGEIASIQGLPEAMGFVANILLFTEKSHLYLEYGPTVPDGQEVTAAIRQSLLFDEHLGAVPIRFELHLWDASG